MRYKLEEIYFEDIHKELRHLTEQDILEMINDYYSGDNVDSLRRKYNINTRNSQFYTIFPKKISDVHCENCDSIMLEKLLSKSSYYDDGERICISCGHKNNIRGWGRCDCDSCNELLIKEELKINQIKDIQRKNLDLFLENHSNIPVKEENLDIKTLLYLSAFCRVSISEDFLYLNSLSNLNEKLSPTTDLDKEIVSYLFETGVIKISKKSNIDDFGFDENNRPINYNPHNIYYELNLIPEDQSFHNQVQRLLYLSEEKFINSTEELLEFWRLIALNESLEYLNYRLNKVDYGEVFSAGEKTISTFNMLLDNFSVSQIQNLIYSSVKSATHYQQENKITRKHAANTVITNLRNHGERAISNNWMVEGYKRQFDIPRSEISKVLFERILKKGDEGFTKLINTENLILG